MKRLFIFLIFVLASCASHDAVVYKSIDLSEKSITVPIGSRGLKGGIKKALASEGWNLVVDKGPSVTQGSLGEDTNLSNYDTFNSRYRLLVTSAWIDVCLNLSPFISYDVVVIDNSAGAEAFTLSGRGCENDVIDKFMQALK